MLRRILTFCVKERVMVLLATLLIIGWGWLSIKRVPLDAIPDIGENQVILLTAWPGQSPKDVEDQVTYPLSVSMLAVPGANSVRGKSMFGYSFVQITFDDDVDFYWARSRVVEQLASAASALPEGVSPQLGPDATGLGQVFYYILQPTDATNLAELRTLQDYVVKYALQSADGVSEVASIGGYVRQYQIEVDPSKLRFHRLTLDQVMAAVRASNIDVGAKTVESGGMEYIIRGRGFIGAHQDLPRTIKEIEETVLLSREGVPVRVRDIAFVQVGPEFRRGALDFNGQEAVGGVVVMRYGENPRTVIENVQKEIKLIEPSLGGVKIVGIYDRTELIDETVATLTTALWQELLVTIVVIVLFLLHFRASLVIAATLPMAVLMAFIAMDQFGVDANIMSLAGIAIAIGTMVDMGIVVSENIYRHLADWEAKGSPGGSEKRLAVIVDGAAEVLPAVITAVSTTIVSFLPVFFLAGRDYKLFAPLAYTKTFALVASLITAILLTPMLCRLFLRSSNRSWSKGLLAGFVGAAIAGALCLGVWSDAIRSIPIRDFPSTIILAIVTLLAMAIGFGIGFVSSQERIRPTDANPVARGIEWIYAPILHFFLAHRLIFALLPTILVFIGIASFYGLPQTLLPLERVAERLGAKPNDLPYYVEWKHKFLGVKDDDWIALDEGTWFYMPTLYPAASFSQAMQVLQTQDVAIKAIPEVENVLGKIGRVESALDPAPAAMIETYVMLKPRSQWRPDSTPESIWEEINRVATLPGLTLATPLYPIEGRGVMLQSGIKAPMAIRIYGDDLEGLSEAALAVAEKLKEHPFIKSGTVSPDIVLGKPYVEFDVDREQAARYGMTTKMVNQVIAAALGGANVTTTVEGRERYPIRIRYQRDFIARIEDFRRLPVVTHTGEEVPLEQLATMQTTWGPGVINSENARLIAHVSFAPTGAAGDIATVRAVEKFLLESQGENGTLQLPQGYSLEAVGSFQNQVISNQRLWWLAPLLGIPSLEDTGVEPSTFAWVLWWTPLGLVPLACMINLAIIYFQFRDLPITLAIFAGIPVAFAGGMLFVAIGDIRMNTAVWIGFIALFGIAVDDGVVMATYLKQVFRQKRLGTVEEIRRATVEAGLRRIRPCLMTTFTTLVALLPVLLAHGRGADVARAMALPVFGGMTFEFATLFVVPVVYAGYKEWKLKAGFADDQGTGDGNALVSAPHSP